MNSFFPLTKVKCGPLKPRKYPVDVIGTPNISFGYRLRERSNCRFAKGRQKQESFFARDRPEDKREYEHLVKTLDFVTHTDRRINKKKVWQRVEQGMAAYEEGVNGRREKLRELILKEEMGLTREVVDQAQHGDDARMDDMRQRTDELRKRREEQRLALVAAKRMQQYLARCPEIREKRAKKSTIEAKLANLAQMADNGAKRESEKELDRLWHELMLKEVQAKEQREVEELKRRTLTERVASTALANQVSERLALQDQEKQARNEERENLERLWESVRQEELRNFEREREKRNVLKRELEEQIVIAKRFLAERARQEAAMDQMLNTRAEEELAKEKANIKESSAALRKELLAYLEYLEDIRREEARRNVEVDLVVEQSMKDAEIRRDLAVKKFKEARARGLREVLRGREQQLRLKCERERRELESRQLEKELLEREIELDAKLAAQARQEAKARALRYRTDLEEQRNHGDYMRRREAEEDEKIRREEARREEEYRTLTEQLLDASENITPHPFKVLLRECAARHAAEKEGLCYCPPPLTPE